MSLHTQGTSLRFLHAILEVHTYPGALTSKKSISQRHDNCFKPDSYIKGQFMCCILLYYSLGQTNVAEEAM